MTKYHLKKGIKSITKKWSLILFIISFILFLLILTPNIILKRAPIFGEWPRILEIRGSIQLIKKINDSITYEPLYNVKIEIGGYKSYSDVEGKFIIKFVSQNIEDIAVIITWNNNTDIQRISYDKDEFKREVIFYLVDK